MSPVKSQESASRRFWEIGFVFFVGTHVFFAPVNPLIVLVFSGLFAGCTYRLVQVESRKKVKSRNLAVFGR